MEGLTDYSSGFDPNIKYEDFPRGLLIKLLQFYSDYIRKLDGFWYLTVKNRRGDDEAFACDTKVWEKMYAVDLEMTCNLYKINGHDVAAMLKAFQMSPWKTVYRSSIELKSPNYGMLTFTHCPTLLALEREGEGREERICQQLELQLFRMQAGFFNPKIQVRARKVPPRTDYSDCCCQWEFRIEE